MTLSCDPSCDQDYVILMSKFEENLGGWGDFITRTKRDKEWADKTRRLRQTRRNQAHPYGDPANRKARKDLAKDLA